jgi:hypothetical protein
VFADQPRLERTAAIAWNIEGQRAVIRQDRFPADAIGVKLPHQLITFRHRFGLRMRSE